MANVVQPRVIQGGNQDLSGLLNSALQVSQMMEQRKNKSISDKLGWLQTMGASTEGGVLKVLQDDISKNGEKGVVGDLLKEMGASKSLRQKYLDTIQSTTPSNESVIKQMNSLWLRSFGELGSQGGEDATDSTLDKINEIGVPKAAEQKKAETQAPQQAQTRYEEKIIPGKQKPLTIENITALESDPRIPNDVKGGIKELRDAQQVLDNERRVLSEFEGLTGMERLTQFPNMSKAEKRVSAQEEYVQSIINKLGNNPSVVEMLREPDTVERVAIAPPVSAPAEEPPKEPQKPATEETTGLAARSPFGVGTSALESPYQLVSAEERNIKRGAGAEVSQLGRGERRFPSVMAKPPSEWSSEETRRFKDEAFLKKSTNDTAVKTNVKKVQEGMAEGDTKKVLDGANWILRQKDLTAADKDPVIRQKVLDGWNKMMNDPDMLEQMAIGTPGLSRELLTRAERLRMEKQAENPNSLENIKIRNALAELDLKWAELGLKQRKQALAEAAFLRMDDVSKELLTFADNKMKEIYKLRGNKAGEDLEFKRSEEIINKILNKYAGTEGVVWTGKGEGFLWRHPVKVAESMFPSGGTTGTSMDEAYVKRSDQGNKVAKDVGIGQY